MVAISVLSLHLSERPFCGSGWLLGCDDPVPDIKTDELSTGSTACPALISLVPRPHPLRGEGSGEKRQDPWFMTSFCNVINNNYYYEIHRKRHERDTEHSASWL